MSSALHLPALRRAISTLGCPELSFAATLALAERYELAGVELRFLGGENDLIAYLRNHYGEPARLAAVAQASSVRVIGLGSTFKLLQNAAPDREALLSFVPWAEALGGAKIRVFDGDRGNGELDLDFARRTWAWWQALRAEHGWKTDLIMETHDVFLTAHTLRRALEVLPGCAVLWDTHHTWRRGGEDPVATWSALRAHIGHVHVKDSVSVASTRHPYTFVLPGEGEFPARALFATLAADGYPGCVSLEWEKKWIPELPPLDQALDAARRHWW